MKLSQQRAQHFESKDSLRWGTGVGLEIGLTPRAKTQGAKNLAVRVERVTLSRENAAEVLIRTFSTWRPLRLGRPGG